MKVRLPDGQIANFPDEMSHEQIESVLQKHFMQQNAVQGAQDELEKPQESKGYSGILSDALTGIANKAYGLPSAVMSMPGEIYGAAKQAYNKPGRAIRNIGAGFGELGHGILSAPGNIRDYLEKKEIVSQQAPSLRLPESILPKEFNYGEAVGVQGQEPGDLAFRGIPKGIAMAPFANKLFSAIEEIPLTRTLAAKPFKLAEKMLNERKVGKINISKDAFKEAKQFLPNNSATRKLLDEAKSGNYKKLFTLQSDIGKRGAELMKSSSGAERLHGRDAMTLKNKILSDMKGDIAKQGHQDISDLITKGVGKYRTHMKYNKPVRNLRNMILAGFGAKGAVDAARSLIPD